MTAAALRLTGRPAGRRSSYFVALFIAVAVLSLFGLVMVLSASAANALRFEGSSWYYFRQQLAWLGIGTTAMVVTMRVDYRFWRRLTKPIMLIALALLTLVLKSRFGITVNGSTRWFGWGPVRLQPSEIAKVALILHCSDLLARRRNWRAGLVLSPVLASFGVVAVLLMLEPNLGTTIICAMIVLALLWSAGAPLKAFAGVAGTAATLTGILAVVEPYRMRRLVAFNDVWANRSDSGYQTVQSLIAVSNGGITGVGLGASRGKWGYLPYAHTDFIFSIIAEELGLIGSLSVILLFLLIGVLGFAAASHAPDDFGHYVAIGITTWLLVQAFMNISVTLGLIPVTGVPLPFLSFGGSSLVVTMGAFGILLNIARQGALMAKVASAPTTCWAVIAGGGTAGHVSPGLAIARALVDAGHATESIHYVGSERGIEARLVPEAGFALTLLPGRGIQRRLTLDNVGAAWGLVRAFVHAYRLLGRLQPRVVVALGGYASVPAAFAAILRRIPIVVAEQNAVPGLANRVVGRFAKACAVSFAGTALPRSVVTGNPVREEVRTLDRPAARVVARGAYGVDDEQVLVAAFGGSLGARRINDAVLGLAESWRDRGDVAIRHVIGERDWDRYAARVVALADRNSAGPTAAGLRYTAVRYEDDMPSLYAAADVAVCRSGASSVAELAAVGLASVLVPLPGAPGDHQTANARALVDAGAAVLVADATLDAARLASILAPLVRDPAALASMSHNAEAVAHRDAAHAVAEIVEECARD